MVHQLSRFKVGDACLYEGERYTIISHIWIEPSPGFFTWHIERLLDPNKVITVEIDAWLELDNIIEHGFITERDGNFYQERTVTEDEIRRLDDPPTWDEVDRLKAQIFILNEALRLKYRQSDKKRGS